MSKKQPAKTSKKNKGRKSQPSIPDASSSGRASSPSNPAPTSKPAPASSPASGMVAKKLAIPALPVPVAPSPPSRSSVPSDPGSWPGRGSYTSNPDSVPTSDRPEPRRCPRCGGRGGPRKRGWAIKNPFLAKTSQSELTCDDCGLDYEDSEQSRAPWA